MRATAARSASASISVQPDPPQDPRVAYLDRRLTRLERKLDLFLALALLAVLAPLLASHLPPLLAAFDLTLLALSGVLAHLARALP